MPSTSSLGLRYLELSHLEPDIALGKIASSVPHLHLTGTLRSLYSHWNFPHHLTSLSLPDEILPDEALEALPITIKFLQVSVTSGSWKSHVLPYLTDLVAISLGLGNGTLNSTLFSLSMTLERLEFSSPALNDWSTPSLPPHLTVLKASTYHTRLFHYFPEVFAIYLSNRMRKSMRNVSLCCLPISLPSTYGFLAISLHHQKLVVTCQGHSNTANYPIWIF
jgi:hypothetical protein